MKRLKLKVLPEGGIFDEKIEIALWRCFHDLFWSGHAKGVQGEKMRVSTRIWVVNLVCSFEIRSKLTFFLKKILPKCTVLKMSISQNNYPQSSVQVSRTFNVSIVFRLF